MTGYCFNNNGSVLILVGHRGLDLDLDILLLNHKIYIYDNTYHYVIFILIFLVIWVTYTDQKNIEGHRHIQFLQSRSVSLANDLDFENGVSKNMALALHQEASHCGQCSGCNIQFYFLVPEL